MVLIAAKMTDIAPVFPFLVICLVPIRKQLIKMFNEKELSEVCIYQEGIVVGSCHVINYVIIVVFADVSRIFITA